MQTLSTNSSTTGGWTGVLRVQGIREKPKKKRAKERKPPSVKDEATSSRAPWQKSLVQISACHQFPNFSHPWRHGLVSNTTSSGVVVNNISGLVLTTAGAVHYAQASPDGDKCQVLVRAPGNSRPIAAYVAAVSHSADLALLQTYAPSALRRTSQVKWSTGFPDLGHPIVAAGCMPSHHAQRVPVQSGQGEVAELQDHHYKAAGVKLQVSRGVVSRVEVVQYSHSGASLLSYQVDATPRHKDCWGGGLFDASSGSCLGVLLQRSSSEAWGARYEAVDTTQAGHSPASSSTCSGTPVNRTHPSTVSMAASSASNSVGNSSSNSSSSSSSKCEGDVNSRAWGNVGCAAADSSSPGGMQQGRPCSSKRATRRGGLLGAGVGGEETLGRHMLAGRGAGRACRVQGGGRAGAMRCSTSSTSTSTADGSKGGDAVFSLSPRSPRQLQGKVDQGSVIHVVPACVVSHFLADLKAHGRCLGFPMPGFRYQTLAAAALQKWLTGQHNQLKGVCVASVPGRDGGWGSLRVHDLITAIDGATVFGDGTVEVEAGLRLSFTHVLAMKHVGEDAVLTVVRDGKLLQLTCSLKASSPGGLLPRLPLVSTLGHTCGLDPGSCGDSSSSSSSSNSSMACSKQPRSSRTGGSSPPALFPWPGYVLVGRAALAALILPGLERLCGAAAAKRAAGSPWHLPAAQALRGLRAREEQTGQEIRRPGHAARAGELWGGSNLVMASTHDGGVTCGVDDGAGGIQGSRGSFSCRLRGVGSGVSVSSCGGIRLGTVRRGRGHLRTEPRASSADGVLCRQTLARNVAWTVHGAERSGASELVVFVEALHMPQGDAMDGLSQGQESVWPPCADLLVSVNGTKVLGLQHLACLCGADGRLHPQRLMLEFASGHVTVLDGAQAAAAAAEVAAAWGIDSCTLLA